MSHIFTVKECGKSEITEKKSKFIANVFPVSSKEDAEKYLLTVKKEYWDAKHCVYAYVLSDGNQKYSDDGEPQGTAGLPILNVINKKKLKNILVTVTRYFGGILLGKGGLMRMYTESAVTGIENAKPVEIIEMSKFVIICDYKMKDKIKSFFEKNDYISEAEYNKEVKFIVKVPEKEEPEFAKNIIKITDGKIKIEKVSEK